MVAWEKLLEKAIRYIINSNIPKNEDSKIHWSFGGGTVLMLRYHHRLSNDIDIFLSNPQFLNYFSPRLNYMIEKDVAHYSEQAEYIKLRYDEGEIDFIAAGRLLNKPYVVLNKFGTDIPCESPLEIIAKKATYRHYNFTVRDFFDLATVLYHADNSDMQEIKEIITPYAKDLQERLQNLDSFNDIQTLPNGNIICKKGKIILHDFLNSELVLNAKTVEAENSIQETFPEQETKTKLVEAERNRRIAELDDKLNNPPYWIGSAGYTTVEATADLQELINLEESRLYDESDGKISQQELDKTILERHPIILEIQKDFDCKMEI